MMNDVYHFTLVYENVFFFSSCCSFEVLSSEVNFAQRLPHFDCHAWNGMRLPIYMDIYGMGYD